MLLAVCEVAHLRLDVAKLSNSLYRDHFLLSLCRGGQQTVQKACDGQCITQAQTHKARSPPTRKGNVNFKSI